MKLTRAGSRVDPRARRDAAAAPARAALVRSVTTISALRRRNGSTRGPSMSACIVILLVLAAPVFLASYCLQGPGRLWDPDYLAFAVLVVFLFARSARSGQRGRRVLRGARSRTTPRPRIACSWRCPRPSGRASARSTSSRMRSSSRPSTGFSVSCSGSSCSGPAGAWLFRISDLLRRRAAFESVRDAELDRGADAGNRERLRHPEVDTRRRLALLGYALSGSFDDALERLARLPPGTGRADRQAQRRADGARSARPR